LAATAHVECVDCHNPHAARATTLPTKGGSTVPTLSGALEGVKGVNSSGTAVNPASFEYEICFRCHSSNNPVTSRTARQINTAPANDVRKEFDPGAAISYHSVVGVRTATTAVPSLLSPWTTSSRMTCTDCHNNNASPYSTGTGTTPSGTGVNGTHGSTFPLLLERQYAFADRTGYTVAQYALCFKCHSSTSIMGDVTFREHNKHISGESTPCNVCHDPHGVPSGTGATTVRNARLINFQTTVVTPSAGRLYWESTGTNSGRCYLVCHGKDHNPLSY
jgi:hypothetical protein